MAIPPLPRVCLCSVAWFCSVTDTVSSVFIPIFLPIISQVKMKFFTGFPGYLQSSIAQAKILQRIRLIHVGKLSPRFQIFQ